MVQDVKFLKRVLHKTLAITSQFWLLKDILRHLYGYWNCKQFQNQNINRGKDWHQLHSKQVNIKKVLLKLVHLILNILL